MIKEFNILATTQDELLYLVPSANCDEIDLPVYVCYNDGLTDSIFSGTLDLSFITFEEYVSLENMFNLRKINTPTPTAKDLVLFFDNEERKVFSSDINLEEENDPDRFTIVPQGTNAIVEGVYLGYNEVITFTNKKGEIYDFSQNCWVSRNMLVDYTNILWQNDYVTDEYKKPQPKVEAKEPTKSINLPNRSDCDLVINYRNESSFYRFPSIMNNESSFQVFDREHNEWKPSKVGPNSIFKMIDEGSCQLIHISELGMIHHGRYKFNNKFTSLFNTIETADYDKMLNQAKTVLSLLNRLK